MIEAETSPYVPGTRLLVVGIFSGLVTGIVIVLLYFSLMTDQSATRSGGIATRVIELEHQLRSAQLKNTEALEKLEERRNQISLLKKNLESRDLKIRDLEEKLSRTEQVQENILDQKLQANKVSKQQVEKLYKQLANAKKKIEELEDENQKLRVRTYFQYEE